MMNLTTIACLVLLVTSSICQIEGANILVFITNGMYSHINSFMPIFEGLAARGHNMTMVSPFLPKKPIPNLNNIVLHNFAEDVTASAPSKNLLEMDGIIFRLFGFWLFGTAGARIMLQDDTVQRFIHDKDSKFDLIILETWFMQEILVAFGHKFNAPVVNLMPSYLFPQAAYFTGNHLPCTYVPIAKLGLYSDRMTFLERAVNCMYYVWDVFIGELYYLKQQDIIMRKYFNYPGSENLPPLVDMLRNTSLTLTDYAIGVGYPLPLHKNVIDFGGLSIKTPEKLPNDLQSFMDKAKDGVIYLSFGSYGSVSYMKPETQKSLILALGKLKQKVLIKLEDTNEFRNLVSNNILAKDWFPQPSIIAHPNCKLFITHGGLHALMEAINSAVPMIVIPLFGDQPINAKFVQHTGIGYMIHPNSVTEDTITYAIHEVLSNPKYRENIKERSTIFKDTPGNSLDNALDWIEYVIKHKGGSHLRPAVLDLYWYERLMFDIIAFYILVLAGIVIVLKIVFKLLFICLNYCFKKSDTKKDKKKSKRS